MTVTHPCPHCGRTLVSNWNLGREDLCPCDGAKADRAKAKAAASTPQAKAKRAADSAKYQRQAAESAVRAARHNLALAERTLRRASDDLTRLAVAQAPAGYDVLRPASD